MVLRCKGFSQERQDSALKRVAPEEVDMPLNSVKIKNPSQEPRTKPRNGKFSQRNVAKTKSKGEKATSKKKANQMVNFILIIHSYSYVNGVELFVKQIDGVESVKGNRNSIRLEVKGKVDPLKIQEMVEHKTNQKVELIFPLAEMEVDRDENKDTETNLMKQMKMAHGGEINNEKTKEGLVVLKIKLCCDFCNKKLQKILESKGLEMVTMDAQKDLVTVKGTVDLTELRSYIKHDLKKEIEIVVPAKVMIPDSKDEGIHYKKDKYAGDSKKKGKDTRVAHKAGKSNNNVDKKYRGTAAVDEKVVATATIDQKHKATNKVSERKGTKKVDEKYKGTTVNEIYEVTTTVYETDKGRAVLGEKDEGIATIVVKDKGSATKDNEHKEKDKHGHINNEKWTDSGGQMKYKASDGDQGGKVRDAVGIKEEDFGATLKLNPIMYYRCDDNAYGYWQEWRNVKYSNGLHQLFSDENPHSCSVM